MARESQDQRAFRKISIFADTRGEGRRILILKATIESLSYSGIHNTTFESVAKIAKMQRSHIAYYFKTREELIHMAIRFALVSGQEIVIQVLEKAKTPEERLCAIIRGFFLQAKVNPKHPPIWTLFWNLASLDPVYRLLFEEIKQMGIDRLEQALELYFADKTIDRKTIGYLARAIQALAFGYFTRAVSGTRSELFEECGNEACESALTLLKQYN